MIHVIINLFFNLSLYLKKSHSFIHFFLDTIRFTCNTLKSRSWDHNASFTWLPKEKNLSSLRVVSTDGLIDPPSESRDKDTVLLLFQLSHIIWILYFHWFNWVTRFGCDIVIGPKWYSREKETACFLVCQSA